MRSGERRSDGGAVPSVKQTGRPSDRVRRDRFSPPASRHVPATTGQAEWKPPPTGNRARSGHRDAKGTIQCANIQHVLGTWQVPSLVRRQKRSENREL